MIMRFGGLRDTYPSSVSANEPMVNTEVLVEKLRNRYSEEEWEACYEEISHRIHVSELKKW